MFFIFCALIHFVLLWTIRNGTSTLDKFLQVANWLGLVYATVMAIHVLKQ